MSAIGRQTLLAAGASELPAKDGEAIFLPSDKKRGWPVLLILLLLAVPTAVKAQFEYSINTDGISITITNYIGSGGAVTIPTNINGFTVTGIGEDAFYYSTMTSVTIPGSITTLGPEAFYGCGDLISVTIPSSVTNIGPGPFAVCIGMTSIEVAAQNAFYSSSRGVLFDKGQDTLVEYPSGLNGSYTIPANVTNLAPSAFEGCTSLTHVTVPASIASIGEYVFEYCYNMTSITLPASVTNIEDHAFYGCNGLLGVTIPANVTSIGAEAFYGCYDLTSVMIPSNVTSIGSGPFEWCIGMTNIGVDEPDSSFSSVNGVLFNKSQDTLVQFPAGLDGSYTVPDSVNSIAASAFAGCDTLTGITIPLSVTSIGENAFAYCYDLAGATISASITNLGADAFYGCNGLTNVTIAAGLTNIGDFAFYGCYGLTSVTIPASVSSLGEGAFEWCIRLTNVYFMGDAPMADSTAFVHDNSLPTAYYLPGTTGWSSSFAGLPAVLWNPLIQISGGNFGLSNNQFGFNVTGTANIPIVVEASINLAGPVWTPLLSLTLTNGSFYFSDAQWTNFPARFYRISSP
jgi:hypothetical protein